MTYEPPTAPPEPWRVAILSAAKHGYVARGVAAHPQFVPVVVADDADRPAWEHERNQKLADEFGVPYVRDVERALREFGAAVACVSPAVDRHCDLSIRAAQAGLHVVQDKPLGTTLGDCDRLVAAIEQAGVRFLMWNRNGLPAVQQLPRVLSQVGTLQSVHLDFYFSKDAGPPKGSRGPGFPPINWKAHQIAAHVDGSDGGLADTPLGELAIEGIYPLAYIRHLTTAPVRRVFARTTAHFHQLYEDNQVDDLASVTLELADGVLSSLVLGRIGAASHPDIGEIKIHVVGTQGAAVIAEARPEVGIYYRNQPAAEFRNRRLGIDNDYYLMESFARAIDGVGETALDIHASRHIFLVVQAALESARTGQPVQVPE